MNIIEHTKWHTITNKNIFLIPNIIVMTSKKTLVLGVSLNQWRDSHLVVRKLLQQGHEVIALGQKGGDILSVRIQTGRPPARNINTIIIYLNTSNQFDYFCYIMELNPSRVIFNPGTENTKLKKLLDDAGIENFAASAIMLLSVGIF